MTQSASGSSRAGAARRVLGTLAALGLGVALTDVLRRVAGLPFDVMLLAAMLSMALERALRGADAQGRRLVLLALPVVALGAMGILRLERSVPLAGLAAIVVVAGLGVWVRRFGPRATRVGTLVTVPMVAVLMLGASTVPFEISPIGWSVAVAAIVGGAVVAVQGLVRRVGGASVSVEPATVERAPVPNASAPVPAASSSSAGARSDGSRAVAPSTRMAIQMVLALSGAIAAGRLAFGAHGTWVVLSAFLVCLGTRGRADVLYKGTLRTLGALAGTLAGAALFRLLDGQDTASLAVMIGALVGGAALRSLSYAWWSAGVTIALSLLYARLGEDASALLGIRLGAVATGALIAMAVSSWVLPIPARDVVRRRVGDALAAVSDVLAALDGPSDRLDAGLRALEQRVAALDEVFPPLAAQRRWLAAFGRRPTLADAIDGVRDGLQAVRKIARVRHRATQSASEEIPSGTSRMLRERVGATRRALASRAARPAGDPAHVPGSAATMPDALSGEISHAVTESARDLIRALARIEAALVVATIDPPIDRTDSRVDAPRPDA